MCKLFIKYILIFVSPELYVSNLKKKKNIDHKQYSRVVVAIVAESTVYYSYYVPHVLYCSYKLLFAQDDRCASASRVRVMCVCVCVWQVILVISNYYYLTMMIFENEKSYWTATVAARQQRRPLYIKRWISRYTYGKKGHNRFSTHTHTHIY